MYVKACASFNFCVYFNHKLVNELLFQEVNYQEMRTNLKHIGKRKNVAKIKPYNVGRLP